MSKQTVKACVDAAFQTPRLKMTFEFVDENGEGWSQTLLAVEYSLLRAEWSKRSVDFVYRTSRSISPDKLKPLLELGVTLRINMSTQESRSSTVFPSSTRARVTVSSGEENPEKCVEAMAKSGLQGVTWVPGPRVRQNRFVKFIVGALLKMIDIHESSDLHDELLVALLRARPWDIPSVDLFETLAFSPDGGIYSSETGFQLSQSGDDLFRLSHVDFFQFKDLPELPLVPALVAASVNRSQPLCRTCVYRAYCLIAPSDHYRTQGSLSGRLPDSFKCQTHLAILDAIFLRLNEEKCINALNKWRVDIARLTC
jgi:hypothetical protein